MMLNENQKLEYLKQIVKNSTDSAILFVIKNFNKSWYCCNVCGITHCPDFGDMRCPNKHDWKAQYYKE